MKVLIGMILYVAMLDIIWMVYPVMGVIFVLVGLIYAINDCF